MRRDRAFAGLAVTLGSLALLAASAAAQDADMLRGRLDADFEAAAAGWFATGGALTTEGGAGRAVATAAGPLIVSSEWWRVPTVPGAAHTLQLRVAADSRLSDVRAQLAFRAADGASLGTPGAAGPVAPGDAFALVTVGPLVSPAAAAVAQITVRATAGAAGAVLRLDGATLARDAAAAPPPVVATAGADPSAPTPPPNATALPTATPTPPRTATAAPRATATPRTTATANAVLLHEALRNSGFEAGLDAWTHAGGTLELTTGLEGAHAALLGSASDTTKWLQQAATVRGGDWYAARALVKLGPRVNAAWLRLAWYASADASGAQLDVADSAPLTGDAGVTATLDTGPVLAPADARSVRVRVLLRPAAAETATIVVDAVALAPATSPEAAAPRPPAAAVRSAPPERPLPEEAPASAVRQAPAPRAAGSTQPPSTPARLPLAPAIATHTPLLRITELLPDPEAPGNDANFEWVELSNLGTDPQPLAGFLLRDNRADTPLPDRELPAGASLVLAAPRAVMPASPLAPAHLHMLARAIGNGLGNASDRLALIAPDGVLVDTLSWGSDATYDDPPLLAPGPGESLRRYFADDGSLLAVQLALDPSPGRLEPPPAPAGAPAAPARSAIELLPADAGRRQLWALLTAAGAVSVLAFAWQRVRARS